MRTPKALYRTSPMVFQCELNQCPQCEAPLTPVHYLTGHKTIQTLDEVLTIAYRPKTCLENGCRSATIPLPSATWQFLAPKYCTYGYDVIAQIGWERQKAHRRFADIHCQLVPHVQISQSQVRHLYHQRYLPLLACQERQHLNELKQVALTSGLLLSLDGLMPEGGEAQLWVVRELRTGLTLRSGWLSCQDEATLVEFLRPIADLDLPVLALISDKQKALLSAVAIVFPQAHHGFCQAHYFKNAAAPVAEADEHMKVALRQKVRAAVGDLIRQKCPENPVVLTVTGLVPSPLPTAAPANVAPAKAATATIPAASRESIIQDLLQRTRYLLTLKGRAPFGLAGLEMFEGLRAVVRCLDQLLKHSSEPRLVELRTGLHQALQAVRADYREIHQAAQWLADLAEVFDPAGQPKRSGAQVRADWEQCLKDIANVSRASPRLRAINANLQAVSEHYAPGLFHTYDVPGLPRTNNDRESEFRDLRRHLLSASGQVGAVKRQLLRSGAWEVIPALTSAAVTAIALAQVDREEFLRERQRLRTHRARFRLHTRSTKRSQAQLKELVHRWRSLPAAAGP
jgi:hypothetical protein